MLKYLILPMLLAFSSANAESKPYSDWDTQDKLQLSAYTALSVIDYQQTSWALKQKDETGNYLYRESNPFLGTRPSDTKLAAAQLLGISIMYYDTKHYGEEHRKFRWVIVAIKAAVVVKNNNLGVSFSKIW